MARIIDDDCRLKRKPLILLSYLADANFVELFRNEIGWSATCVESARVRTTRRIFRDRTPDVAWRSDF